MRTWPAWFRPLAAGTAPSTTCSSQCWRAASAGTCWIGGEPLDAMVLRAIVPVSRRLPGQPVRPGNLVSAMFVELPVDVADPAGRLAAVAARTAEQKSR